MATSSTRHLTASALFIALGILFPILFHGTGLGSILLPMFWPVALSAFFLPLTFSLMVGVLTPVISFLVTGMPPISPPILYVVIFELMALVVCEYFLFYKSHLRIFFVVLVSLFASRVVLFIFSGLIAPMLGLPPKVFSLLSVIKGMPGVFVMIIIIPLILRKIKQEPVFAKRI